MAATGARLFSAALFRRYPPSPDGKTNSRRTPIATPRLAVSVDQVPPATVEKEKRREEKKKRRMNGWNEYLERSKELIKPDGGPPRWFSPLECASRLDNSPLLLFLPGKFFFFFFNLFYFLLFCHAFCVCESFSYLFAVIFFFSFLFFSPLWMYSSFFFLFFSFFMKKLYIYGVK